MSNTVLVTGATGFIGTHLVNHLTAQGHTVIGLSRNAIDSTERVRWIRADVCDAQAVAEVFAATAPDVVYHLASSVTGSRDVNHVLPMLEANLTAAVNILVAASQSGSRRVVLAGSMEETDLSDSQAPASPYAAAKAAQTLYGRLFQSLYGTPVVLARIFMVYGPGQSDVSKVVPYSILRGLDGMPAELKSGNREVDWIHVDDVVRGLSTLGAVDGIEGHTLDLGSGELVTITEMVGRLAIAMGSPAPIVAAQSDRQREIVRRADVDTTFARTGFRPEIALADGLESTIDWYRNERATGRL